MILAEDFFRFCQTWLEKVWPIVAKRPMPILSLENVTKDYDSDGQRVRALDGVTLAVETGQFVTLVGRSGCGKSTLLNLAGGMDFALTGEVKIDGISPAEIG